MPDPISAQTVIASANAIRALGRWRKLQKTADAHLSGKLDGTYFVGFMLRAQMLKGEVDEWLTSADAAFITAHMVAEYTAELVALGVEVPPDA